MWNSQIEQNQFELSRVEPRRTDLNTVYVLNTEIFAQNIYKMEIENRFRSKLDVIKPKAKLFMGDFKKETKQNETNKNEHKK